LVQWYHLILSAYGFWLPNDPRGSWSDFVGAWELLKFGGPTTVSDGRSYAHDPHDRELRLKAKRSLKFPAVRFDSRARHAIGQGFARAVEESKYDVRACSIGYDHSHLIMARHDRTIEKIATHLKSRATMSLQSSGCHPLAGFRKHDRIPTPWAVGTWSVFLRTPSHLKSATNYVRRHSEKEGMPAQHWSFVHDEVGTGE
jgi:REP element-mobilizing transposase RayT